MVAALLVAQCTYRTGDFVGLHSPNEKYRVENYFLGIMTIAHFFEQL